MQANGGDFIPQWPCGIDRVWRIWIKGHSSQKLFKTCNCSSELVTIMILSISVEMDYFQTAMQAEILLHINPLAEVSVSFRYDDGVI